MSVFDVMPLAALVKLQNLLCASCIAVSDLTPQPW
jgi:hypothetical protein